MSRRYPKQKVQHTEVPATEELSRYLTGYRSVVSVFSNATRESFTKLAEVLQELDVDDDGASLQQKLPDLESLIKSTKASLSEILDTLYAGAEAVAGAASTQEVNPVEELRDRVVGLRSELRSQMSMLTGHQSRAFNKIVDWLLLPWSSESKSFVLRGYAGTGKTFLLKTVRTFVELSLRIRELRAILEANGLQNDVPGPLDDSDELVDLVTVVWTAPTHQAATVLSEMVQAPSCTIQSFIGMRARYEEDRVTFEVVRRSLEHASVIDALVTIDESSMVNAVCVREALKLADRSRYRLLWVGDPAQLNPIGEEMSEAFSTTDVKAYRTLLRDVVRYSNDIIRYATEIRTSLDDPDLLEPPDVREYRNSNNGVRCFDPDTFDATLWALTKNGGDAFDKTCIIAYRNAVVDRYNKIIRSRLGFTERFCVGEKYLAGGALSLRTFRQGDYAAADKCAYPSISQGREFTPVRVFEQDVELELDGEDLTVPCFALEIAEPVSGVLLVPIRKSDLDWSKSMLANKARAEKAWEATASPAEIRARSIEVPGPNGKLTLMTPSMQMWHTFWALSDSVHDVRYRYARTAHSAQGTTFERVFVDQQDILNNGNTMEAFRCLYVAVTRASEQVTIKV